MEHESTQPRNTGTLLARMDPSVEERDRKILEEVAAQEVSFEDLGWLAKLNEMNEQMKSMESVPDSFIESTGCVQLCVDGLERANTALLKHVLAIIDTVVFRSDLAFEQFMELDPARRYFIPIFLDSNVPWNAKVQITIIVSKMIDYKNMSSYLVESNTMQTILGVIQNPEVDIRAVQNVLLLTDTFIRHSNEDEIRSVLEMILRGVHMLWSANKQDLAEFILPVLSDLCKQGFVEIVVEHFDVREFVALLENRDFIASYGSIARLLAIIIKHAPEWIQLVPCDWILDLMEGCGRWQLEDYFALLKAIAKAGFVASVLEQDSDKVLVTMITGTEREYRSRELALLLLWHGFVGLKTVAEQAGVMESSYYPLMVSGIPSQSLVAKVLPILAAIHDMGLLSPEAVQSTRELLGTIITDSNDAEVVDKAETVLKLYL